MTSYIASFSTQQMVAPRRSKTINYGIFKLSKKHIMPSTIIFPEFLSSQLKQGLKRIKSKFLYTVRLSTINYIHPKQKTRN